MSSFLEKTFCTQSMQFVVMAAKNPMRLNDSSVPLKATEAFSTARARRNARTMRKMSKAGEW